MTVVVFFLVGCCGPRSGWLIFLRFSSDANPENFPIVTTIELEQNDNACEMKSSSRGRLVKPLL